MITQKPAIKLSGKEQFKNVDSKHFSVLEFWQYGFSSLNSNVLRGALAEFLVENALKENIEIGVRNPWGDYDVFYKNKKIEVKCSSFIQDWNQGKHTVVRWSGLRAKKLYYSEVVEKLADISAEKIYKSDIYVFALFKHQDLMTLDILDMNQWDFWVLTREKLKEITKSGGSLSLIKLQKNNIKPISFADLNQTI